MNSDTGSAHSDSAVYEHCGLRLHPALLDNAVKHLVYGRSMLPPWPPGLPGLLFGGGCFWGVERLFWKAPGVVSTAVGYAGGHLAHPDYRLVCQGDTGHAEVVLVVWNPDQTSVERLTATFLEAHDPTQGMRQGNDIGTQYRSVILGAKADLLDKARGVLHAYDQSLREAGHAAVTTTVEEARDFWYAESDHQQYLRRNPNGYCGLGGTGVVCRLSPG